MIMSYSPCWVIYSFMALFISDPYFKKFLQKCKPNALHAIDAQVLNEWVREWLTDWMNECWYLLCNSRKSRVKEALRFHVGVLICFSHHQKRATRGTASPSGWSSSWPRWAGERWAGVHAGFVLSLFPGEWVCSTDSFQRCCWPPVEW